MVILGLKHNDFPFMHHPLKTFLLEMVFWGSLLVVFTIFSKTEELYLVET